MRGISDPFAVQSKLSFYLQLQTWVLKKIRSFIPTNWDNFKTDLASMLYLKKRINTAPNLKDGEIDEAIISTTDAMNTATFKNKNS